MDNLGDSGVYGVTRKKSSRHPGAEVPGEGGGRCVQRGVSLIEGPSFLFREA